MKKRLSMLIPVAAAFCLAFTGTVSSVFAANAPAAVTAKQETAVMAADSNSSSDKKTDSGKKEDKVTRSILTNKEIDPEIAKQRPIAVMYPINYEAQPQYGLSNVDVFYEMIEEGSMSRQMGIIQDWQNIGQIGNIRSTRSYFVLEAMRYDPIMIHFGGPIDWLI